MTIRMNNLERLTLVEMGEFVTTSRHVTWPAVEPGSVYRLVERVLKAHSYRRLSKGQRGIVKRFLAKITALSRAQLTRLIRRWMDTRRIERKPARHPSFHRRGDQRQRGSDPGGDGADRHAGSQVPAVEIDVSVVVVASGRAAAAATVLLSRSVGVAGRSISGPAGSGRRARRCATACNHVVGSNGTAEN